MTDRPTGPRCGNNPNTHLTDGDRKAVDNFKARLALRAAVKPYVDSAAWVDGDPLMEVIAATVWDRCARDDEDMPQLVCDDPRTIAAFAAAVARAHQSAELFRAQAEVHQYRTALQGVARASSAGQAPATDRAALRERIAETLWPLTDWDGDQLNAERAADAVLAVVPAPTDRAAVLTAADRKFLSFALDQAAEEMSLGDGFTDEDSAALEKLRRMTVEAQPGPDLAAADNPTALRWGLNDVLWGDDDTVTVLMSGPGGEPYRLELDQERAAVLREDLAGPEAQPTQPMPCSQPNPCEDGQLCDQHETEQAHANGEHEYCDITCETQMPTAPMRNAIVAHGIPGTTRMLDELLRRAAAGLLPTVEEPGPDVVAFHDPERPTALWCRKHGARWWGLTGLTSDDLPDGGVCGECGVDVLIPQEVQS
ncbi:hypothetical protein [Streptomyces purpurascens]|uniref:hypothetical protein n=1 Tax=Streptomyces purpurascens TaxID=1924 RepID=UPI00167B3BB9|nr:hypothetical protein [Streptomyces purpurascens]MCE7049525.1 hypothetical protein [Streptomyces purpurascens]GHA22324.1 hypothetical protein GCM10010303_36040 [Streptomyces purpurascens]